ncbi:MAG: ABC transporter transmembrane domain-containing protein, partial [Pseudomonas sp.]
MPNQHQETECPTAVDTALSCLVTVARFHHTAVDAAQLRHEFAERGALLGAAELLLAAKKLGLKGKLIRSSTKRLGQIPLPAIAQDRDGKFFVLASYEHDSVLLVDPQRKESHRLSSSELATHWTGDLILLRSEASLAAELSRFDFTWFIPAIVKYRKLLGEVLLVSFVLQIFALLTPLFFQVVMDKVLVHRSLGTLDVLAMGLLGIMLFETALSGLRTYVFAHTASRIDVELGSRLFAHLVHLPLGYFQARRVGDSVARVRELENIRSFLTGNSITLVLDVLFSLVFVAVMFVYSGWLTLVVVLSLPLYFLISLLITPLLRARLNESFNRGAENQAFLVESISGIDTLKSMAVEPQVTRRWDNQLAAYVRASFRTQTLSTVANESVGLVGKLVTVATLWLGARLVIDGQLSVGQLIAFNMLAGRVAQPIMRLAQLWTNFQQTGVSVQRLGDILNSQTERSQTARSSLPPLKGHIEFDQVHFRYRADGSEVLRGISLTLQPG